MNLPTSELVKAPVIHKGVTWKNKIHVTLPLSEFFSKKIIVSYYEPEVGYILRFLSREHSSVAWTNIIPIPIVSHEELIKRVPSYDEKLRVPLFDVVTQVERLAFLAEYGICLPNVPLAFKSNNVSSEVEVWIAE